MDEECWIPLQKIILKNKSFTYITDLTQTISQSVKVW